jgi:hypothetical protein
VVIASPAAERMFNVHSVVEFEPGRTPFAGAAELVGDMEGFAYVVSLHFLLVRGLENLE